MQQEGFVWFATLPSRFNRTLPTLTSVREATQKARVIRQEAKESIAQSTIIHHLPSDKYKKIPASENKRIPVFRINPLLMLNLPDACQYIR